MTTRFTEAMNIIITSTIQEKAYEDFVETIDTWFNYSKGQKIEYTPDEQGIKWLALQLMEEGIIFCSGKKIEVRKSANQEVAEALAPFVTAEMAGEIFAAYDNPYFFSFSI